MAILHLGVLDLPYADPASYKATKTRKPKTKPEGSMTTGDVADILEDKYHPMEVFFELHSEDIGEQYLESMQDALDNIHMGAPATLDLTGDATAFIEDRFKQFLTNKEMESLGIPGVPTKAALEGHSKRFKQPYKKRNPRPSFIDTGLYQASFKAWIE